MQSFLFRISSLVLSVVFKLSCLLRGKLGRTPILDNLLKRSGSLASTLKTSEEDVYKTTLETSEEYVDKTTLKTSEEDVDKTTLETSEETKLHSKRVKKMLTKLHSKRVYITFCLRTLKCHQHK
jgi:hypothetical protein